MDDALYEVNRILVEAKKEMTFETLGKILETIRGENTANLIALKKYGENHAKLATLIDLAVIGKKGNRSNVEVSVLGKHFYALDKMAQKELVRRLLLRIPIVQNAFKESKIEQIDTDMDILSVTTKKRRRSNVINVIRSIVEDNAKLSELINLDGERSC